MGTIAGSSRTKTTGCTLLKNMKVISAYMLAVVGGNTSPTAADVNKILSSIGANLDGEESKALDSMIAAFGERSHEEILKEGLELIKDCGGSGGGGGGGAAGPAAASGGGDAPAAKKKTTTEEEDEMAAAPADLFGGGDDY